MKCKVIILMALVSIAFFYAFTNITGEIPAELAIGSEAPKPEIKMKDVSGNEKSLNDLKLENGLLVIFSCNTCPYVKLSEARYKENAELAKKNKIGFVLINSNEAQRNDVDSWDEMKKHANDQKYTFSYLVDNNSELADAFGATRTPHCFLFDKNGKLVYRGAIDDNIKVAADAKTHYLKDAITVTGKGDKVKTNSTKSIGCTIKRVVAND